VNDTENLKNSKKNFAGREGEIDPLLASLSDACRGLVFISETDAEIVPFAAGEVRSRTTESYLEALHIDGKNIEEASFDNFFARLTAEKDWHRAPDKKRVRQFSKLQKVLEKELEDLRVLRVGRIRIDIYVVGVTGNGRLVGVKTKAIET
jgi:hypothetical protein